MGNKFVFGVSRLLLCILRRMQKVVEGPLGWLIGCWKTQAGSLLNPRTMTYNDTFQVQEYGGFLKFDSASQHPEKSTPMHFESGYLRFDPGDGKVALMLAHNFGVTELLEGQVNEQGFAVESTGIHRMSFSNDVRVLKTKREYLLSGNTLTYNFYMSTNKNPEMTLHL